MCLMDSFGASPRGHMSTSAVESYRLFHELNTGEKLPTVQQLKFHRESVVHIAGSNTSDHTS
jgi:hypothetical protein